MSKSVKWQRLLYAGLAAWFAATVFAVPAVCQSRPDAVAAEALPTVSAGAEAPLVFWNRTIFVFRSSFQQLGPDQRAAGARTRIEALPEFGPWTITATPVTVGTVSGILISVISDLCLAVTGDLDPEAGETLEQAASQAVAQLRNCFGGPRESAECSAHAGQWDLPLRPHSFLWVQCG
jgi:hypothetical protein